MLMRDEHSTPTLGELVALLEEHKQVLAQKGERPTSNTVATLLLQRFDLLPSAQLNLSVTEDDLDDCMCEASWLNEHAAYEANDLLEFLQHIPTSIRNTSTLLDHMFLKAQLEEFLL